MIAKSMVKYYSLFFLLNVCSLIGKSQLATKFGADQLSGCAPLLVNFIDSSSGNPTSWQWDLGDGTISFLQNPSITYFNPGQYTIKLIIKNATGEDSLIKVKYIIVNAIPTAEFSGNPLIGCAPLKTQFNDLSTAGSGSLNLWQWDFGDGTIGNNQNPSHTYTSSGNFNVTLQVRNSFGCIKTIAKTSYVVVGKGVTANFSNNTPASCNPPALINFQNLSTGSGTLSYEWDFGDGGTSTQANPSYNYAAQGLYTVRLIAVSSEGCRDTIIKKNAVLVGAVIPSFTNSNNVCVNTPFVLTSTTIPIPTSVLWEFGDGDTSTQINPVKSYALPGIYSIKLIATLGGCKDSTTKNITIINKPSGDFTSTLSNCSNHSVNFTNTTPNAVSYVWNFGDSTATSTSTNPVHVYDSAGTYTVTLISTNANGCKDTLKKSIQVQLPQATITTLPDSSCSPIMKKFTATINSPVDSVISYLWDFGDGTTSNEISPTHNFNTGVYTIKLIITTAKGCKDTATLVNGIIATEKPVVDFVANPTNVCAYVPVQFLDKSTGTVTKWLWKFGDSDTSALKNPIHIYRDTGYMDVQLTVWNRGCSNTITFLDYIYIKPPIAKFNFGYSCSDPYKKSFFQFSIGADEWVWDFGDGDTSTAQHPIHTYAATGNYTVLLTVKNNTTGCYYTTKRVIPVVDEKPNFTASDSIICKRDSVTFTAVGENSGNIYFYSWDFGDGMVDTGKVVTHTYLTSGYYTVRLILTDRLWCRDTLEKKLYIRVNGPTANFSPSQQEQCLLSTVLFNDSSVNDGIHPIVKWNWNYGDSTFESLTAPPFQHTYTKAGMYPVFLEVIDSNGCMDSITLNQPLIVSKPTSNFAALTTISCPNKNISFRDSSLGLSLQYAWNFGDGATSNVANPVHKYAQDGLYTVRLIVTDQYGCTDTLVKLNYIEILTPVAGFTMSDSVGTCPPLVVNFINTSINFRSVTWDFGDGTSTTTDNPSHFYSTPGVYNPKLIVTSWGGCTDTIQKQVTVFGPSGSFSYGPIIGCTPTQINFVSNSINAASFVWDFNDGSVISSTDSAISHTYTTRGTYVPKMILIDVNGCRVPIIGPDTINIKGVTANFNFSKKLLCDPGTVQFYDSTLSNDLIVNRQWDFGDGSTSNSQNPSHFYSNIGMYYPRLITTTLNGCIDTVSYPAPIKVIPIPRPQIASTANGCTPLNMSFNGQLLAPDTSAVTWNWDLKNGNTSNLQNPPVQVYDIAGNYAIRLIVTNSSGCADTVLKNIEAYQVPTINAGADEFICFKTGVTLNATGADSSYSWSPATGLSCTDCSSPVANPDSLTNYIVTGTTVHGCTNTDTIQVKVKYPFTINTSISDTLCRGDSKRLFAAGGYTYVWSPATGLSDPNVANPIANPISTITYTVVGTDDLGCFKDTGYVPVTVYPLPGVNAGPDKTINIGETAILPFVYSADVISATWAPNPSILSITTDNLTVKPRETTEYTIEVKNQGGCKAKDKVTVFVICNGDNVFIPNTFSPNGDGINDKFYPRGKGLFSIKTLRIFNRWGEVVYEKNDFMPNDANSGWDGTYKGVKLTPDVYVYMVNINCDNSNTLTFKGNVTLIQ